MHTLHYSVFSEVLPLKHVHVLSMHVYVHVFACGSNYAQLQHKHAAEEVYCDTDVTGVTVCLPSICSPVTDPVTGGKGPRTHATTN